MPRADKNYIQISDILTINGAGIGVAVFCLVVYNLVPIPEEKAPLILGWLAIIMSLICSYVIYVNTNFGLSRKPEDNNPPINFVVLWLVNGCFIFLSASGVNYLNNSKNNNKKSTPRLQSFIPFVKDVSWWPDANLVEQLNRLNNKSSFLNHQKDSLNKEFLKLSQASEQNSSNYKPDLTVINYDSLKMKLLTVHVDIKYNRLPIEKRLRKLFICAQRVNVLNPGWQTGRVITIWTRHFNEDTSKPKFSFNLEVNDIVAADGQYSPSPKSNIYYPLYSKYLNISIMDSASFEIVSSETIPLDSIISNWYRDKSITFDMIPLY